MKKRVLILDLDNTIYPVSAIADDVFKSVFLLIEQSGEFKDPEILAQLKDRIMRQPFQFVARDFSFSEKLLSDCMQHLVNFSYEGKMEPFTDYARLRAYSCPKHLVTTGFTKLQHSKIKQLGIAQDFISIHVIDPHHSKLTKKDIFQQILTDHSYQVEEILVVGDDPNSEIKAAKELGIPTLLYNHNRERPEVPDQATIYSFVEIDPYLN